MNLEVYTCGGYVELCYEDVINEQDVTFIVHKDGNAYIEFEEGKFKQVCLVDELKVLEQRRQDQFNKIYNDRLK